MWDSIFYSLRYVGLQVKNVFNKIKSVAILSNSVASNAKTPTVPECCNPGNMGSNSTSKRDIYSLFSVIKEAQGSENLWTLIPISAQSKLRRLIDFWSISSWV
jgi:hypothetical protein